ncbi:ankyrin repeat domain 39 [Achlya hypogyna]|uniref:Ankyrin repeat domain 39 n=1 Tax=Achlya hypogyna TaxID=1202772 RepID=A0A1V9ZML2_ACHHY|nr:ankyrin repeat domain 39 [Achlya hypogyna]
MSSDDCPCRKALLRKSIFTAAQDGDLEHVRSFFECHKAHLHVDFPDDFGYTSLHYAAQWDRVDVVSYLLRKGATVDSRLCGATALHRAAFRGAANCVRLLLEHNADVNLPDTSFGDLRTAIHKAASQGHEDIVQLLLVAGANPTLQDARGLVYTQCRDDSSVPSADPRALRFDAVDAIPSPVVASAGLSCDQCGQRTLVIVRTSCCRAIQCESCQTAGQRCVLCGILPFFPAALVMEPAQPLPSASVPVHIARPKPAAPIGGLFNLRQRKASAKASVY